MARPTLGSAARTVTASTKISRREADALLARHRSVHEGVRAAVELYLASFGASQNRAGTFKASRNVPLAEVQETLTAPCRIHKAYTVTSTWFERGVEWVERTCGDCGHVTTAPAGPGDRR
jgi:hypothetical protein